MEAFIYYSRAAPILRKNIRKRSFAVGTAPASGSDRRREGLGLRGFRAERNFSPPEEGRHKRLKAGLGAKGKGKGQAEGFN